MHIKGNYRYFSHDLPKNKKFFYRIQNKGIKGHLEIVCQKAVDDRFNLEAQLKIQGPLLVFHPIDVHFKMDWSQEEGLVYSEDDLVHGISSQWKVKGDEVQFTKKKQDVLIQRFEFSLNSRMDKNESLFTPLSLFLSLFSPSFEEELLERPLHLLLKDDVGQLIIFAQEERIIEQKRQRGITFSWKTPRLSPIAHQILKRLVIWIDLQGNKVCEFRLKVALVTISFVLEKD